MVPSEAAFERRRALIENVPSYGWQAIYMYYAYILQSQSYPGKRYRGHTTNLKQRLIDHNAGKCPHTSKFLPWKLSFYAAFETLDLARKFEQYLKSGSGHSFSKRHFGILNLRSERD